MEQIDLFPLNTVFFPGGLQRLQVFEVRYLDMVKRCVAQNLPFGIVGLTQGREVHRPGVPEELASIGTLAYIKHHENKSPGLMVVDVVAGERFNIVQAKQGKYDLWSAQIERLAPDPVVALPSELEQTREGLQTMLDSLTMQGFNEDQLPFAKPYHFNDCGWVANRWCELLPLDLKTKQQLMSLDNPLLRLELVNDMLSQQGIED